MEELLKFDFSTEKPSIIKVIGVGGGGGNAVTHMYKEGILDVNFVLCNTDSQALLKSEVPVKIQLGKEITEGLGAGNKPEVAEKAALESKEEIRKLLSDGTKMVFVTAGMGGGTGTGAAPIVAEVAKSLDILTIGIVTIPFLFERGNKIIQALSGVEKMSKCVDALLVINNEKLREVYPDLNIFNAFKKADDTLLVAAQSIAEIITVPGHVNLDFADVNTTLKAGGVAVMSSGLGEGESRLTKAIESALHSPLLNNNDIFNAKKILLNIYSSENNPIMMEEMSELHEFMSKFSKDIEVIWGAAVDDNLEEKAKITILATGFSIDTIPMMTDKKRSEWERMTVEERRAREAEELAAVKLEEENTRSIRRYYGEKGLQVLIGIERPQPHIFTFEQLNDNDIIDEVINTPAYKRDSKKITKLAAEKRAQLSIF
ncbi:MAG: cell division protein FtsZ [Dysgonamonadaceae bacterium]|nr:cell division protein FtsZ [Dysgonamonadaceae bacterium]